MPLSTIEVKNIDIEYKIEGQEEIHSLQTRLPEGTKEISLPANCSLVGLYGLDNNLVKDVIQRKLIDKTGEIRDLFGLQ